MHKEDPLQIFSFCFISYFLTFICSHSIGSKSLFRFVCPDDPSSHLLRIVKLFDYQIASLLGNRHFFLWLFCSFLELDLKSPPLQSTLQKPKIDGFSAFRNRRRFFYGIFKILSWSWKLIYKSWLENEYENSQEASLSGQKINNSSR